MQATSRGRPEVCAAVSHRARKGKKCLANINAFFSLALLMLLTTMWQANADASSGGIAGRTNRDGGGGCAGGGCHGNQAADAGMSVVISGPASLLAGASGVYTVTSTKAALGSGIKMGVNIAASNGTLSESAANLIISGNEIVHSQPSGALNTTNAGGSASYSFTYTMPAGAVAGSTRTLYATSRLGFSGAWNHAANFTVTTATPAPVITSATTATGTVGSAFSYVITATNSPTSFGASNVPPGTSRSGATISGTPTTAGSYNMSISATNAGGTDNINVTVTINNSNQTITFPLQDPQSRTFVSGSTFSINPLASASSGLAVSYSSATPAVCTVSGITVTMVALGTCTLSAEQLGNANYFAASPVQRSVTLSNTAQFMLNTSPVATGNQHSCARRQDGTVSCWGDNEFGRVGAPIGGPRAITVPVVVSGLSNVASLELGTEHSCALIASGAVQCWGSGNLGQLGIGALTNTPDPVLVTNLNSSVVSLAAGGAFNCAVLSDGTVRCWGDNQFGTLGNGSLVSSSSTPVAVSGITNAVAVTAGNNHACVLRADNSVACWGSNAFGQLGVPNTVTSGSSTPVAATLLDSPVIAISAGDSITCALTARRGVKCWGFNLSGQLGGGTTSFSGGVTDVIGLSSGVATISSGGGHVCARLDNGSISCWGANTDGRLGDGTTTSRSSPVGVVNLAATTISETGAFVAAGGTHTCALLTSGRIRCWGGNGFGQLGNATQTNSSAPVDVLGFETIFASDVFSANNDFARRSVLSGGYAFSSTSNVVATDEADEPLHAGTSGARSVWWTWTAPETRRFTLSTAGSTSSGASPLNTALAVYTGSTLAKLFPIVSGAAAVRAPGAWSQVTFNAVRRTTYQIAVDRATDGFGGRVVLSIVPTPAGEADLSGDGKSDIVFRDSSTGNVTGNLMNGVTVTGSATLLSGDPNWTVTHTGDFNGDGKADILWRNTVDGTALLWLMNGTTVTSSTNLLGGPDPNWRISHVGDFNGDGKADIVWRNNNAAVTLWLMNGGNVIGVAGLLGAEPSWQVSHIADFNGDGKDDILWYNASVGIVTQWLMNGTSIAAGGITGLLGGEPSWSVSHVGDFNGDGNADILWRNTNGTTVTWLLSGGSVLSAVGLLGADPNWRVSHVADFDGDGKTDVLWRNNDGSVTMWLMNGGSPVGTAGLLGPDPNWRVSHTGDYNGDGKADLLWRNNDGSITMWLMNGLTTTTAAGIAGPGSLRVVP